ncbi:DUF389 domain-containing protein [Undibacterium luofuense]|uniref:DUF389 domain-containing protein n=1 Tax=Undibacterium luofuense TaxID=2828733 RepID=UPI0030EDCC08
MNAPEPLQTAADNPPGFWRDLRQRFHLNSDKADDRQIDETIRAGVSLSGSNLWALICAILLASIGLNVNSASAIIGAMLISPLMGPIVGAGYGIAIYDFALVRKSLKNLAIASLVSLLASGMYFFVSPLGEAQSELLARTSPTLWDVLIALAGGVVGVIGATRKDKGNVIPGVAIATALMPPLCTAGFGLAHGNWTFMLGALYLFSINSVFIAFATLTMLSLMLPRESRQADQRTQYQVRRSVTGIVALTAIPSIFLAYDLVSKEVFQQRARQFIAAEIQPEQAVIAERRIQPEQRSISLKLVGQWQTESMIRNWQQKLADYQLQDTRLDITQAGQRPLDLASLRQAVMNDPALVQRQNEKDVLIQRLQQQLSQQQTQQQQQRQLYAALADEIRAQYPQVSTVRISRFSDSEKTDNKDSSAPPELITMIDSTQALSRDEQQRLQRWLAVRLQHPALHILVRHGSNSSYLPPAS